MSEADYIARQLAVLRWSQQDGLERLMADPYYYDARIAGWWLHGMACHIGTGYASGDGPWIVGDDGRIAKRSAREPGVSRQLPHVSDNGQGVNRPQMREAGVAVRAVPDGGNDWQARVCADYAATLGYHPMTMPKLRRWFDYLSARFRHVRIINGDWKRVVTTGVLQTVNIRKPGAGPDDVAGIFFDPPYAGHVRDRNLYRVDSDTVAADVRAWCAANGDNPRYRIVLKGFAGEGHEELEPLGWRVVEWFEAGHLRGGYGNQNADGHQQHRERLWLSPHCLGGAEDYSDLPMFVGLEEDA